MAMTLLGDVTPREVIHKHESHKLHQAFNPTTGQTIYKGNPCFLMIDGTITPQTTAIVPAGIFVGIAVTDSIYPAYKESRQAGPIEVTVAAAGYVLLLGEASVAIATAGYVAPVARSTDVPSLQTWEASADPTPYVSLFPVDANDIMQIMVLPMLTPAAADPTP